MHETQQKSYAYAVVHVWVNVMFTLPLFTDISYLFSKISALPVYL